MNSFKNSKILILKVFINDEAAIYFAFSKDLLRNTLEFKTLILTLNSNLFYKLY